MYFTWSKGKKYDCKVSLKKAVSDCSVGRTLETFWPKTTAGFWTCNIFVFNFYMFLLCSNNLRGEKVVRILFCRNVFYWLREQSIFKSRLVDWSDAWALLWDRSSDVNMEPGALCDCSWRRDRNIEKRRAGADWLQFVPTAFWLSLQIDCPPIRDQSEGLLWLVNVHSSALSSRAAWRTQGHMGHSIGTLGMGHSIGQGVLRHKTFTHVFFLSFPYSHFRLLKLIGWNRIFVLLCNYYIILQ